MAYPNSIYPRITITILFVSCTLAGCSRGLKEGLYVFKGSSGKIVSIKGDKEQMAVLAYRYGDFQIEPFTNDVGAVCPQEFLDHLPVAIKGQLSYRSRSLKERIKFKKKQDTGPFFTGPEDKIMLIKGRVIQYDAARYDASGIIEKAIGPLDEAICRVQILDRITGTLIAEANCIGRAKSSVRTGPKELAEGIAKSLRKWLKPKKTDDEGDKIPEADNKEEKKNSNRSRYLQVTFFRPFRACKYSAICRRYL